MEDRKLKFIGNANKKFNNFYNYDKFVYVDNLSKSIVTCPIHGDFEVKAADHTSTSKLGGCRKCWIDNKNAKISKKHKECFVKCKEVAFKYETKSEFQKYDTYYYRMAHRLGCIDDVCSHMTKVGNLYHRCVYSYEFKDLKSVYVGLTYDIHNRDVQHRSENTYSSVKCFSTKNNVEMPEPIMLTEYVDKDEAAKLEGEFILKYKNNGWDIINKNKAGALGGHNRNINYTKEDCFEIAKKYKKVSDCEKENFKACQILRKNGWIKDAFPQVFNKFKIVCFNSDGEFLKIYDSPTEASIEMKIRRSGISNCINNNAQYVGHYQFIRYINWVKMGSPLKINEINFKRPNSVKVIQLCISGELINEFDSIADATKFIGRNENDRWTLTKACQGKLKTAYGYKWMYKEDYEKYLAEINN